MYGSKPVDVKGSVPDAILAKLIADKALDALGRPLVVGDKVAVAYISRSVRPITVAEIIDFKCTYYSEYDYSSRTNRINMDPMKANVEVILKPINRGAKVTRHPSWVVKVS